MKGDAEEERYSGFAKANCMLVTCCKRGPVSWLLRDRDQCRRFGNADEGSCQPAGHGSAKILSRCAKGLLGDSGRNLMPGHSAFHQPQRTASSARGCPGAIGKSQSAAKDKRRQAHCRSQRRYTGLVTGICRAHLLLEAEAARLHHSSQRESGIWKSPNMGCHIRSGGIPH